jgi:hypothetical protein
MTDERSAAQVYLRSRAEFRDRAARSFTAAHPLATSVIASANDLVAGLCLFASGKNFAVLQQGLYVSDLLVSFCRTHFVAAELITHVELVDAGVLIRKQMELVARLRELCSGADVEALLGRTPNVKHLAEHLRRRYGEYSQIAHSSHPKPLYLLGRISEGEAQYTPFYPVFDANAYVALSHLGFVVTEFGLWATNWFASTFPEFATDKFEMLLQTFWEKLSEFHRVDLDAIRTAGDRVAHGSTRSTPGMLPGTSPTNAAGRADFLALAALFELRRRNLEQFETVTTRLSARTDLQPSTDPTLDHTCRLSLALAYQQAVGCVNFVAHAVSTELAGEGTADELFRTFVLDLGIDRSIDELTAQTVAELEKIERKYDETLNEGSLTPASQR